MKRTDKIREALIQAKIMLENPQIEAMAQQCPDFDMERAVNELILREPTGATAVLNILKNHRIATAQEWCGNCQSGWVKVLDRIQWNEFCRPSYSNMAEMISIKAGAPCPNCQPNRTPNLKQIIQASDPDEQAFTWLLLYDMALFNLGKFLWPTEFDPAELWGVYLRPDLPGWMSRLKDQIWEQAHKRETINPVQAVDAVRRMAGGEA